MTAPAPLGHDRDEIIRAVRLLVVPDGIAELRALDATIAGDRRVGIVSGYFDSAEKLADAATKITSAKGIYITVNVVNPDLLARAVNRIRLVSKEPLTADHDIRRRIWLLIDADPCRAAGISSTEAEHEAALDRIKKVREYLRSLDWPDPILADSGNGAHLLYFIDLPRDDGGLVQRCLAALAAMFDDAVVKIDTSVHNPARIWKLYGTVACKGDATAERPHRLARLIDVPEKLEIVPEALLLALAAQSLVASAPKAARAGTATKGEFDLAAWVGQYLPDAEGPKPWLGAGQIWTLPECPFNSDHIGGSAFVGCMPSGAIIAGCQHNSCERFSWRDLRAKFESAASRPERSPRPQGMPSHLDGGAAGEGAMVPAFAPTPALDLIRDYPELRPVLIEGLLRAAEVMNIVAAPKVGKSWLVLALALAVVSGGMWLGKSTRRGAVLIIDGELHHETLARRLHNTRETLGVDNADLSNLQIWVVRGRRLTIDDIEAALLAGPKNSYALIIIDALYRFLPLDGEENANETMTRIYNALDAIAKHTGAAIAVVHHATKGNQSEKAVTDVGAGAGAQSRAADTHLILRPHEEDGAVVVDAAVRSFPPMDAFVIRSMKPGWALAPELDPTKLKAPRKQKKEAKKDSSDQPKTRTWTPEEFAAEIVGTERLIRDEVLARADAKKLGKTQAVSLLNRAVDAGKLHRHQDRVNGPHRFSTTPPAILPGMGEGEGVGDPPTPGANAPGGCGGGRATPLPPSRSTKGSKSKPAKKRRRP